MYNGKYYYIFNEEDKKWHALLLPATGVSPYSDPYLVTAFWTGMKYAARYATPLEDAIVLIDGKDFDGNEASQAQAGIFLIVGFIPGGKLLKPVAGIAKGAYRGAKVAVREGGKTIVKNFDDLLELTKILEKLNKSAKFVLQGTGAYNRVGGHHPLAKVAFSGDDLYDLNKAFSVSREALGGQAVHNAITGNQNRLYSAFAKSGNRLTLEKMAEIEIQAMVDAGIPRDVATGWIIKALEDLKAQGVKYITNIPWNGAN